MSPYKLKLFRLYHMAAKRMEESTGVDRHDWQQQLFGKESSKQLTIVELKKAISMLAQQRFVVVKKLEKSGGLPATNNAQWRRLAAAARDVGYNGLYDMRTAAFITHTCKCKFSWNLPPSALSAAICGLERMYKQRTSV